MKKLLCLSALIIYVFACCPSSAAPTPIVEPPTVQPSPVPPEPTDTPAPSPPSTETPLPTDTLTLPPPPTATPLPTDTPQPEPPTATLEPAADCRDVNEVGWLMDYDCRGEILLYAEPKPPSQTQVVTVVDMTDPVDDGTCDSLIVDIDKECLVDGILYYHVDVGELGSGWADVDYVYPGLEKPQR